MLTTVRIGFSILFSPFYQSFRVEETASVSYTQIQSIEDLAFLVFLSLMQKCLRIRPRERERERVNAAHSPLCGGGREYGSHRVLPYIHEKNRRTNLGLEVTVLKQAKTLSLKLSPEVL